MNAYDFYDSELAAHQEVAGQTARMLRDNFVQALALWSAAIRQGGKILFFGNGGSAGDAQHLATELTIRYSQDRAAIPAIALTTDTSALTACGNDFGFERIFARQIEALGKSGDVAVGISTSGRSKNVCRGLRAARALGLKTITLTGGDGGHVVEISDVCLIVPSAVTARIQEMHIMLGQMLCGALELELGLVSMDEPKR
ncbi:MAG: D-sedoheptulose 7-phosphate isomerase [Rhodospirillales bacterium]|nr:D-sedoheptulose 7-phosphate isomerase [Rhodospirillales bacterium]